jgi:hypothetical protein
LRKTAIRQLPGIPSMHGAAADRRRFSRFENDGIMLSSA